MRTIASDFGFWSVEVVPNSNIVALTTYLDTLGVFH